MTEHDHRLQKLYREELSAVRSRLGAVREQLGELELHERGLLELIVPETRRCEACQGQRFVTKQTKNGSSYDTLCNVCEGKGVITETF